jgi:zinc/manganese transport system substrate-binding protein
MHTRHKLQTMTALTLLLVTLVLPGIARAQLTVFACEPEWAALTSEIGGDRVTVFSATHFMQDPHHIQARPSLIAKARQADLLICSGAELEAGWLPLLLRKAGNANIMSGPGQFFAADYIQKLEIPEQLDRSLGDVHAEGNPHVHTSPENLIHIAHQLSERLALLDAAGAEQYRQAGRQFQQQWKIRAEQWKQQAAVLQGLNIICHHKYWSYLVDWLGMKLVATLEPLPGVAPSSQHLAKVSKLAEQQSVAMIVHVAYVSERPANWLAERTGLPVVSLPASVDYQSGQSLDSWFSSIIDSLTAAADIRSSVTGNN